MATTKKQATPQKTTTTTVKQSTVKQSTAKKTTAKKTTAKKAIPQEIIHSVVFTVNQQDKELLEAIEQELDAAVFANFDELCKEALYQFLWEDESRSIQQQLNQVEQSIVTQNATVVKQLEQIQTQVESLQQRLSYESQDFAFVPRLEIAEVELETPIESIEIVQPAVAAIVPERDPFLDRLSALLEDF